MLFSLTISIVVLNLSLGFPILIQSRKDIGAKVFFLTTVVFSILTYVNYQSLTVAPVESLFWIRAVMFFAALHVFLYFVFVHSFSRDKEKWFTLNKRTFFSIMSLLSILWITISPFLFQGVHVSEKGRTEVIPGTLLPVFALWLIGILLVSIHKVWKMYTVSTGNEKEQWKYLLVGTSITYSTLILFNFVLSSFFNNSFFVQFTPLFSLPVVVAVAYAVVRHNLFSIKINQLF